LAPKYMGANIFPHTETASFFILETLIFYDQANP
jgi:hypothetical protein